MPLTKRQRKERLGHGTQREIARQLGVSDTLISAVVNNKTQSLGKATLRKVRVAIAERIGEPVEVVFGSTAAAA